MTGISMPRPWHRLVAPLAVAMLAALLLFHLSAFEKLNDDSFISFRYARNLAAGRGLVFNPGERVEGYTNPLWVLIAAGLFKAGVAPEVGMVWVCLLCAVLALPLAYAVGRLVAG
jgi:arabinofuranosyltransferase